MKEEVKEQVKEEVKEEVKLNFNLDYSIENISKGYLASPYGFKSPLGEGIEGKYDQDPMITYPGEETDCTSLVETVLARSIAEQLIVAYKKDFSETARRNLELEIAKLIRYKNGEPSFVNRRHFTSTQWIPNLVELGIVEDVTESLFSTPRFATQTENPYNWIITQIQRDKAGYTDLFKLKHKSKDILAKLRQDLISEDWDHELASRLPYIHVRDIYNSNKTIKDVGLQLFDQMPTPLILNVVTPNFNSSRVGSPLNISHQGLVLRNDKGVLIFRNASSSGKEVIDVELDIYLKKFLSPDDYRAGVNLLSPQMPSESIIQKLLDKNYEENTN